MSCKLEVDVRSAVLSYRPAAPEQRSVSVGRAELPVLYSAARWRTFRGYSGQCHYSGWYWTATARDLVIDESRWELAALMTADYLQSVRRSLIGVRCAAWHGQHDAPPPTPLHVERLEDLACFHKLRMRTMRARWFWPTTAGDLASHELPRGWLS